MGLSEHPRNRGHLSRACHRSRTSGQALDPLTARTLKQRAVSLRSAKQVPSAETTGSPKGERPMRHNKQPGTIPRSSRGPASSGVRSILTSSTGVVISTSMRLTYSSAECRLSACCGDSGIVFLNRIVLRTILNQRQGQDRADGAFAKGPARVGSGATDPGKDALSPAGACARHVAGTASCNPLPRGSP